MFTVKPDKKDPNFSEFEPGDFLLDADGDLCLVVIGSNNDRNVLVYFNYDEPYLVDEDMDQHAPFTKVDKSQLKFKGE